MFKAGRPVFSRTVFMSGRPKLMVGRTVFSRTVFSRTEFMGFRTRWRRHRDTEWRRPT